MERHFVYPYLICHVPTWSSHGELLSATKKRENYFLLKFSVQEVRPKHHPYHTGDDKQHPEGDSQQLHTEQRLLALLYDLLLTHEAWRRAVRPVRVHLLHPQADGGQDDEARVPAVALQGEHHPLGDRGQAEGHGGHPGQDAGVAGQGEGVPRFQGGEVAAQGAGDGWRASGVGGLVAAQLDLLEALGAKDMQALQHPGAFAVRVVLLVADGTLHIHGLPRGGCCCSWVSLLGNWDNIPCHGGREGERRRPGSSAMVRHEL